MRRSSPSSSRALRSSGDRAGFSARFSRLTSDRVPSTAPVITCGSRSSGTASSGSGSSAGSTRPRSSSRSGSPITRAPDARIAATCLVEEDFDAARLYYRQALASAPTLFEAHYGLAVLEREDGQADRALARARKALELAPTDRAAAAARALVAEVEPYASAASAPAR